MEPEDPADTARAYQDSEFTPLRGAEKGSEREEGAGRRGSLAEGAARQAGH